MMTDQSPILLREPISESITALTLNRPKVGNEMNAELLSRLKESFEAIEADEKQCVVIIQGTGDHFCEGTDIKALHEMTQSSMQHHLSYNQLIGEVLSKLNQLDRVVIGVAQGAVKGVGMALMACCDYVLAEHDVHFACPSVQYGLLPAVITPYLVQLLGPTLTRQLLVTGRSISREEAFYKSLIHEINHEGTVQLKQKAQAKAYELLNNKPSAVKAIKHWMQYAFSQGHEALVDNAAKLSAQIELSDEVQHGINDYLNRSKK